MKQLLIPIIASPVFVFFKTMKKITKELSE